MPYDGSCVRKGRRISFDVFISSPFLEEIIHLNWEQTVSYRQYLFGHAPQFVFCIDINIVGTWEESVCDVDTFSSKSKAEK